VYVERIDQSVPGPGVVVDDLADCERGIPALWNVCGKLAKNKGVQ
jgi:hypothetical protein